MAVYLNGVKISGRGVPGKSPYQLAVEEGYTGTEIDFNNTLANIGELIKRIPDIDGRVLRSGDRMEGMLFLPNTTPTDPLHAVTKEYADTKLGKNDTASSALKLTTNAGSAAQPIYFSNGIPVASNMIFNWSGQTGQPSWLWGSNDGSSMYVYNPSNFNVNSATTATNSTNATNGRYTYCTASQTGKIYVTGRTATTTGYADLYQNNSVYCQGTVLYGAAWNDYAEYRKSTDTIEPGRVVVENGDDTLSLATKRLMPGCEITSDTFGFAIGQTEECQTPIAVSGRVLAYPMEDRNTYNPGDAVCSGENGTVSKMTREEIINYPERIIGTVSAIPDYDTWGEDDVPVNGRIWIKVK